MEDSGRSHTRIGGVDEICSEEIEFEEEPNINLAQKIIFATIGTINGIAFNWAGFVAEKIRSEISTKRKIGKIVLLLCSVAPKCHPLNTN